MAIQIGGLSNNGAIPLGSAKSNPVPIQQPQTSGVINLGQSSSTPISQGNVKGILTPGVNQTIKQDPAGNIYNAPKSNPSVLAQQQALNKLGAGLVEDGIAGDKTRAAIAKYGSGGSTTPVITDSSKVTTGGAPISAQTQASTVNPITGVNANNSTTQNTYTPPNQGTQGVSQGGLIGNAVAQSQGPSPEYLAQQAEANRIAGERANLTKDFAQQSNQIAGTAGFLTQQTGLQGLLQNQYNQGQGALSQQEASATSRLNAANTARQLEQSALGTAINANAPITGVGYGTQTINPGTGLPISGSSSGSSGILQGSAANLIPQYYNEYNQAQSVIDNIGKNEKLFGNLLSTAKVNPTDLTPINEVLQRVGQLTSSADYANFQNLLSSLRANYAQLLASRGLTPTDAGNTANSLLPNNASVATINSVLSTLKQEGQNYLSSKADQLKRAQDTFKTGTAPDTSTPTNSTGGGFGWDILNR